MTQLTALAWKEWREVRAFFWIAVGVFVGLPVIAGVEAMWQFSRRFEVSATPWVFVFGGVLAVFVAVGATCRDFGGRLEDFWQSRPVSMASWLGMKYVVGLVVVMVACVLPMLLDLAASRDRDVVEAATWSVLWTLPTYYSLGFLAGCLMRRAAHAAMLALAAMLVIYLLPLVLPPVFWLSAVNIEMGGSVAMFALGFIGIAALATAGALVAVVRGWRLEAGRKMMYGAVGVAILIVASTAGYQLGTNMPVLGETALPPAEWASYVYCDGTNGFVITDRYIPVSKGDSSWPWKIVATYRSLELTADGIKLGEPQDANGVRGREFYSEKTASPHDPAIFYYVVNIADGPDAEKCVLDILDVRRNTFAMIDMWHLPEFKDTNADITQRRMWGPTVAYSTGNRLYVIGRRLVTLDISDADKPKIISNVPFSSAFFSDERGFWAPAGGFYLNESTKAPPKLEFGLPPIAELSAQQRLDAVLLARQRITMACFDDGVLCETWGDGLVAYRLTKLTAEKATFERIGEYDPSSLAIAFGQIRYGQMEMRNGLLYVSNYGRWAWGLPGRESFNPHVTVFDLRGEKPLRVVGHFAAQGAGSVCPLGGGKAIVGGSSLWVVGPPRGIKENATLNTQH